MDEISRYVAGVDVGTANVRAVIASISEKGQLSVIGVAEVPNSGMRRGVVVSLAGPHQAVSQALLKIEQMSSYNVHSAAISINGPQIVSLRTEGMITVGTMGHEINLDDLERVEEVALQGQTSPNHRVLRVVPLQFTLDGQSAIKNPLGMTGLRLEMQANVVATLAPSYDNLCKVAELAEVQPEQIVPSAFAAARAVLTERQMENGVALVDIGASTTGVAIFEESDLQYIGVVPVGSNNITNDLAVMLAIDTEIAEEIKRRFATGNFGESEGPVVIRWRGKELRFERDQIDEVVQARLEEILELVRKELKKAHYEQRLPEGIVLTGGGARMRDIEKFVRSTLNTSVKIGVPTGLMGVTDNIERPEFATAVGLMLMAADGGGNGVPKKAQKKPKKAGKKGGGFFKRILGKF